MLGVVGESAAILSLNTNQMMCLEFGRLPAATTEPFTARKSN
jgi:hypothetical protein